MSQTVKLTPKTAKAQPAKQRAVRGAEGEPKKGEPGYNPKFVDVPAVPEYEYNEAEFTFIDGDATGEKTFIDVFESLFKGNYKSGVKALVKGWNFYAKKNAAPKSDAKKLKALRTLAESLGLSLAEIQAKLGV